jgi:biopolymer transport protein ExbD
MYFRVRNVSSCTLLLAVMASCSFGLRAQNTPPIIPERPERITIHADDPSGDVRSLLNAVRASDAKEVRVSIGESLSLEVRPETRVDEDIEVKPDPLLLIVTVDAKGDLQLNKEKVSNLSDTSPLIKRLRGVFNVREETGILRPGKNEIEKTVWLQLHASLKIRDLATVATAVQRAGSDRIGLWIDERTPLDPPEPGTWPELPMPHETPKPKRKPSTRKP